MKKLLVSLLALTSVAALSANAQDMISMRNGHVVKAKVVEVEQNSVKYRLYEEPDGPLYTVGKLDISSIEYENGRVESYLNTLVAPGMKYKQYNELYNPHDYVKAIDDRFSPVWGGICSFVLPGLGQMINGEVGRGFAFLGADLGCSLMAGYGAAMSEWSEAGIPLFLAGSLGMLACEVWSIVDGVRVGKIKNLYFRDTVGLASIDFKVEPFLATTMTPLDGSSFAGGSPVAGMTFALRF